MNSGDINVTLQIKEEQLNIAKQWLKTGDVHIYKETFSTEKNFTIPIEHEELVIEKKNIITDNNAPAEVIRIPISEEQVEFTKHTVKLEDVSVYKQQIKDIRHIEETLNKEKFNMNIYGSPKVINNLNRTNS